jgi:cyclic pyranopterin monophosphate synthase
MDIDDKEDRAAEDDVLDDDVLRTRDRALTHVDETGRIRMVDVGAKPITHRRAIASGFVRMSESTVDAIRARRTPKGDPLETCRLAGIMGAKATSTLIPLCHPLQLSHVDVRATLEDRGVRIEAEATVDARTGVEMEALTAVTVAALTIYDMCKALDREMVIEEVRLERKSGGRSGDYARRTADPSTV